MRKILATILAICILTNSFDLYVFASELSAQNLEEFSIDEKEDEIEENLETFSVKNSEELIEEEETGTDEEVELEEEITYVNSLTVKGDQLIDAGEGCIVISNLIWHWGTITVRGCVIVESDLSIGLSGKSALILEENANLTIEGNLDASLHKIGGDIEVICNPQSTLLVGGNFTGYKTGGALQGYFYPKFTLNGNITIQGNFDVHGEYVYMSDESANVIVEGNYSQQIGSLGGLWSKPCHFTEGSLEVKGNYYYDSISSENLSGNHTIIFSGESQQDIFGIFKNVVIRNKSYVGANFESISDQRWEGTTEQYPKIWGYLFVESDANISGCKTEQILCNRVESIRIEKLPTQLECLTGNTFDGKGMILSVEYADGIEHTTEGGWTINFDSSLPLGKKEAEIEFGGKCATIEICLVDELEEDVNLIEGESLLLRRVKEYTAEGLRDYVINVLQSDYSDDKKMLILNNLFKNLGYTDVQEGINYLVEANDKILAYNALIADEMYCAYNFTEFLYSDNGKAIATNLVMALDGLLLNGEISSAVSLETYVSGDYPIVKDYKAMLLEFMKDSEQDILDTTYVEAIKDSISFSKKLFNVSTEAKEELEYCTTKEALDKWVEKWGRNNNLETSGFETKFTARIEDIDGKTAEILEKELGDVLDGVSSGLSIICDLWEDVEWFADLYARIETVGKYEEFLNEIIKEENHLPVAMRAAASQILDELDDQTEAVARKVFGEIIKQVNGNTKLVFENVDIAKRYAAYGDSLATLELGAFCVNALLGIDSLVKEYRYTLGYGQLSMVYGWKLQEARTEFVKNPTEENAFEFYKTYILLHSLREHGENAYIELNTLDGFVGALGLYYDYEKIAFARSNIKFLKDYCQFNYEEAEAIAYNDKIYNEKIVVLCPVTVSVYDEQDNLIVTLYNEPMDLVKEEGRFISLYQEVSEDYAKILYFNVNRGYRIEIEGTDTGIMSCLIADEAGRVKTLANEAVREKTVFTIEAGSNKVGIDRDGDGKIDETTFLTDKTSEQYVEASKLSVKNPEIVLSPGEVWSETIVIEPAGATTTELKWASSNPECVEVHRGRIWAKKEGSAIIKVWSIDDPNICTELKVLVNEQRNNEVESANSSDSSDDFVKEFGKEGKRGEFFDQIAESKIDIKEDVDIKQEDIDTKEDVDVKEDAEIVKDVTTIESREDEEVSDNEEVEKEDIITDQENRDNLFYIFGLGVIGLLVLIIFKKRKQEEC